MSFTPSMSRLALARRCLYPWTGGVRWPPFRPSVAASFGTGVSHVAECCAVLGDAPVTEIAEALSLDARRLTGARDAGVRDPLDVPLAQLRFHQPPAVADAA